MIKRIYHHYSKMEEFRCGMWRSISKQIDRDVLLKKAIEFTGNTDLYGNYMLKVIDQWPFSCEHNLSCNDINKQAWIGHAACCIAINCPEDITRLAWHHLTKKQQDDANLKADKAIEKWEIDYMNKNLPIKEKQMELF